MFKNNSTENRLNKNRDSLMFATLPDLSPNSVFSRSPTKKDATSDYMNGRAIDLEHWETTIKRAGIFEKDEEPKNWNIS